MVHSSMSLRAAVQLMFELLDVGGCLVILEAGNPYGSHTVRTARQLVLDVFNNVDKRGRFSAEPDFATGRVMSGDRSREQRQRPMSAMILPAPANTHFDLIGASVVGPCTHDQPCPLGTGSWCSFSQKVID